MRFSGPDNITQTNLGFHCISPLFNVLMYITHYSATGGKLANVSLKSIMTAEYENTEEGITMNTSADPIGVFDSGVGGISTLKEAVRLLPTEDFIYYGDTANAPYGTKSTDEVMKCVRNVLKRLLSENIKALLIACNTATSVAAATLRQELSIPVIGMEPALKPASMARKDGNILVLATPVTLALPKFQLLMSQYGEGAIPVPCPGLMDLVERRDAEECRDYLGKLMEQYDPEETDAVVLGCTHYVFLRGMLETMLPKRIMIADGNAGTARQLQRILEQNGLERREGAGSVRFLTSGDENQANIMKEFFSKELFL